MRIDVFHDTACPWCRIGKAHLKQALAQWGGERVEVYYHPFFLNPDIPSEGYDFQGYMFAKGGGRMPLEGWFDAPRRMGAAAGIVFNFEKITRAPNTLRSHRLIALTPPDKQEAMIDAIYTAYFEQGQDIGDLETLVKIGGAQGFDEDDLCRRLQSREAEAEVIAAARQAQQLGINGVPFFVFNNLYAFSGAQPPEVFLRAIKQGGK
jgi:predicted DsbA family dithiol-disulfide isomerase